MTSSEPKSSCFSTGIVYFLELFAANVSERAARFWVKKKKVIFQRKNLIKSVIYPTFYTFNCMNVQK